LYDLDTDIGEQNNVAEKYPDIVEEMDKIIKNARVSDPNWPMYTGEFE
jgi:hypothetical protein